MSLVISKLRNRSNTVKISLPNGVGDVTVVYRPTNSELQEKYDEHMQMLEDKKINLLQRLAKDLSVTLVDWDVVDENGNKVAPSEDFLSTLDNDILIGINNGITEHMYPPRKASGS